MAQSGLFPVVKAFFVSFGKNIKRRNKMKKLDKHYDDVISILDYEFQNPDLLYQAFTRRSFSTEYGGENNEVLEFIGDKVLDFFVVKILAERYGFVKSELNYYKDTQYNEFVLKAHKNEKDFTEIKKEIVSNKTLAKRIDKLKLNDFLFLGSSDVSNHVENQEKVKADLFEAILGAIAIDSNWDGISLQNAVEHLLQIDDFLEDVDDGIERPEDCSLENAINTLKELAEHGYCSPPEYYLPDTEQTTGKLKWMCTCRVPSWRLQKTAYATSKKLAKKYAAYLILCKYFDLPNEYEGDEADE